MYAKVFSIQIFQYFHQIPPRVCTLVLFSIQLILQLLISIKVSIYGYSLYRCDGCTVARLKFVANLLYKTDSCRDKPAYYSRSSGQMCQLFQHNSHQNKEPIMLLLCSKLCRHNSPSPIDGAGLAMIEDS